jgi:predicted nucleic acid-binding protein
MPGSAAIVCDASVLASIAFGDLHSEEARALARLRRLFAPSLLRYELAHVAVRRSLTPGDDWERVRQAFSASLRVPVRLVEPAWEQVFKLARAHRLSAYDASYLQVALALEIPLATLDKALAAVAEELGIAARPVELCAE